MRKKSWEAALSILVIGTSMNSGKTTAAGTCCSALSSGGVPLAASKITGTAGRKDILLMRDAGAEVYNDFNELGYPSTYLLEADELMRIFDDNECPVLEITAARRMHPGVDYFFQRLARDRIGF